MAPRLHLGDFISAFTSRRFHLGEFVSANSDRAATAPTDITAAPNASPRSTLAADAVGLIRPGRSISRAARRRRATDARSTCEATSKAPWWELLGAKKYYVGATRFKLRSSQYHVRIAIAWSMNRMHGYYLLVCTTGTHQSIILNHHYRIITTSVTSQRQQVRTLRIASV